MKAVLMSIQPNWCKFIWAGMKTVEVRKTRPTLETPFKAYIYCTGHDGWIIKSPKAGMQKMDSRVIGEFTCDKIDKLTHVGAMGSNEPPKLQIVTLDLLYKPADELLQAACLTEAQAEKYLKGGDGYGWHISDLKIYDKPKSILDFHRAVDKTKLWCEKCAIGGKKGTACAFCYGLNGLRIRRPPQSWCYVEELSNE
nr:MAG TPA: hypothetical protein [Caudoviricetes sp.]